MRSKTLIRYLLFNSVAVLILSSCTTDPLKSLASDPNSACIIAVSMSGTIIVTRASPTPGTSVVAEANKCTVVTGK